MNVDYIFIPFLKNMKQTPIFDMALRQILMLVIVLLLFTIFPLWNCTGFYLAMCQKKKVFSVLPIYLESTSKNGCYAALVTVPVYMTEHLRETVEEKDWLGCMGPLIMASFSISRHTVRQNTMEGEYRAAVVCFMLGRKMKGTKKKKKKSPRRII